MDFLPETSQEGFETGAENEQVTPAQSQPGFQGDGGACRREGWKTLAELAQDYDLHPNQITTWRTQLLEGAAGVFGSEKVSDESAVDVKALYGKIGELTLANDFLEGSLGEAGLLLSVKRWRSLAHIA